MAGKPYHRGQHPRLARIVTTRANNNPNQTCPTCGLTRAEGIQRWGKNGEWEAGHRIHGDTTSGYHAQHRHCNRSEGSTYGNNQRRPEPKVTRWW